ncbi:PKD domain-containing protein [Cytophagaceae bacterium ABcell3]|nr:PKD domain-containing protein [Cytophagaceae bacterium ABcell3]
MRKALFFLFCFFVGFQSIASHEGGPQFIENKGQWDEKVQFLTDVVGGRIFFQRNEITWLFYNVPEHVHTEQNKQDHKHGKPNTTEGSDSVQAHAYNVVFQGANEHPVVQGEDGGGGFPRNYFLGNDTSRWASSVHSYNSIKYENLYDGIDMVYKGHADNLKYDFVVAPGADPANISMLYNGADEVLLNEGNLQVFTSLRTVTEKKPYAYQLIDEKEVEVKCDFVVIGNTVSFSFPEGYDDEYPLVIDPEVVFSTYSGSRADNWGFTATYDDEGHAYSGGIVFGLGFPTTHGAYSTTFGGNVDIAILKYTPNGRNLVYATYLGGGDAEVPISMVVNGKDELVVMGLTSSHNYPVLSNAFQVVFGGGRRYTFHSFYDFNQGTDLVINKLSSNGTRLLASTYLGGSENDGILNTGSSLVQNYGDQFRGEVIVDAEDNIYIASRTNSSNFPVSSPIQESLRGSVDAIVVKLNSSLTDMYWGTYLGGSGVDAAVGIQLDSDNNIFVTGGTASSNFPIGSGGFRPRHAGFVDGFVLKIANDGGRILGGTFLGTTAYDMCFFVQVDEDDDVYVLGQSRGDYPVYNAEYFNRNSRQFIHKLNNSLRGQVFSTVIGSSQNKNDFSPTAFMVNQCKQMYFSGWGGGSNNSPNAYFNGNTNNLPTTSNAFQRTTNGSDFYISVIDVDASGLTYGTYVGGSGHDHVDGGTSRFDNNGVIYQSVCSCGGSESNFPTTPGVWSPNNRATGANACNNALIKFNVQGLKADFEADPEEGCAPLSVRFTNQSVGATYYFWNSGDGRERSSQRPDFNHTYHNPGVYEATLIAYNPNSCDQYDTAVKHIEVFKPDIDEAKEHHVICYPDSAHLNQNYKEEYSYEWSPGNTLSNSTVPDPFAFPDTATTYTVLIKDENNCEGSKEVFVDVARIDSSFSVENITDCKGLPRGAFHNDSYGPLRFTWDLGDGSIVNDQELEHTFPAFGTYHIQFTVENELCSWTGTDELDLPEVLAPNLITPNNDGKNDFYEIKGMTENWRFDLYNRWGDPVYSHENYDNTFGGEGLSEGVYYYLITTPRGVKCKGWLHLMR